MTAPESAKETYDRYASVYDETNAQNDYEMWLGKVLLPELEKLGLRKDWALDVGCGTGRAFDPLLDRGWRVVGSDVSSGMLAEARRKFGDRVRVFEADARSLPVVSTGDEDSTGEGFSLILLLNDVVNYMTDDGDLEKAFAGVKQNLSRRQGLVVFDANTLSLFRHDFASGLIERAKEKGWEWQGLTDGAQSGGIYEARFSGEGVETHVHRQKHWSIARVKGALEASGLRCVAAFGQREEGGRVLLSEPPDEERDAKIVYVAAHGSQE
ncbi:MAG TPA: class I SAM-dependent methyltransferase [Solirubrobacterales bacterium]|nr:class I SAM-dependent methyltransferase [Solirubrobacterales bacterium]